MLNHISIYALLEFQSCYLLNFSIRALTRACLLYKADANSTNMDNKRGTFIASLQFSTVLKAYDFNSIGTSS